MSLILNKAEKETYLFDSVDQLERAKAIKDYYENTNYPTLLRRVKAMMVDFMFILLIFSIASVIIDEFTNTPVWVRGGIFIVSIYLYEPILISLLGGTIGHKLLGIRVTDVNRPIKNINLFKASKRFLVKYLLGWISFLTVTANPRRRAIHDISSSSIVLYK